MELLAVLLLVVVVLPLLLALLAAVLGARALRRRNRVSPEVATPAPTSWLAHPGLPARLHRRLRAAVAASRTAAATAPDAPQLTDLAAEVEREAAALDGQLVAVAALRPAERRAPLRHVAQQVAKLERIASQISVHAVQSQASRVDVGQQDALDDLAERLDALEQARREVSAVEAAAGVRPASPFEPRGRATAPGPGGTPATG